MFSFFVRNKRFPITSIQYELLCNTFSLLPKQSLRSSHVSNDKIENYWRKDAMMKKKLVEERKYRQPVDWLPFQWHRRRRFSITESGGDTIRANIADNSLPKPDFEFSDELKEADETVKKFFSLETGSKGEMREVCRRQLIKRVQRHPVDFNSLEVQIAEMTIKVRALMEHKEKFSKQERRISFVTLPILIQKRNKLLKLLRNIDNDRFLWLLDELELWYEHQPLGLRTDRYCKKWDLRRLTREYCQKLVADKKDAYHRELKEQQQDFLKEKEDALRWIAEEEKALGVNAEPK